MATRPAPPRAEGIAAKTAGLRWAVGVSLASGFLAGTCTGAASETGAGLAGLLAAGAALTAGVLFRLLAGNCREMMLFGIVGMATAAASWFLPFIILGIVSLAIAILGGIAAAMVARWWLESGRGAAWLVGSIAAIAILLASVAVTIAYWEACQPHIIAGCMRRPFHYVGFGLAAGALPALAGAGAAKSATYICRRDDARRGRRQAARTPPQSRYHGPRG